MGRLRCQKLFSPEEPENGLEQQGYRAKTGNNGPPLDPRDRAAARCFHPGPENPPQGRECPPRRKKEAPAGRGRVPPTPRPNVRYGITTSVLQLLAVTLAVRVHLSLPSPPSMSANTP